MLICKKIKTKIMKQKNETKNETKNREQNFDYVKSIELKTMKILCNYQLNDCFLSLTMLIYKKISNFINNN